MPTAQVIGGGSYTNPASGRSYAIQGIFINVNADLQVTISVSDANGNPSQPIILSTPATSGGAIVDQFGIQIAASVPANIATDVTNLVNDLKSALASAVAAGKFNR